MLNEYKNLSVDIETLGTTPGSVVLSIGAVAFNTEALCAKAMESRVSVLDSLITGFWVDKDTLEWWRKQDAAARAVLYGRESFPVVAALRHLSDYVAAHCAEDCRVWMKGPSFDGVLLKAAADKVGVTLPWSYWQERCVRTICDAVTEPQREGVHHSAVDDAVHQAQWVREALLSKMVLKEDK